MHSKLPEDKRRSIFACLDDEPSDTILAKKFGVHRKTIWRLRKEFNAKRAKESSSVRKSKTIPPPPTSNPPEIEIPKMPIPNIHTRLKGSETPPKSPSKATTIPTARHHVNVSPKVDTVKVRLGTYFAVQKMTSEHYPQVSKLILEEAEKYGVLFRKLQVMEMLSVGATSFYRFRTDCEDVEPILRELGADRAVILQNDGGYHVRFPSGRKGKYPTSHMCMDPKAGYGHIYSGTRIKRWRQQF